MDDLHKLESLNLVSRVTQELVNHLGIHEKVLAEFIISQHEKSSSLATFKGLLGNDFPENVVESIDRLITKLRPRNAEGAVQTSSSGLSDFDIRARTYSGLAIPDDCPTEISDDKHQKDINQDNTFAQLESLARFTDTKERSRKRSRSYHDDSEGETPTWFTRRSHQSTSPRNGRGRARSPEVSASSNTNACYETSKARKEGPRSIERQVGHQVALHSIYEGTISAIKDFGAFVTLKGFQKDGLVHVSNIHAGHRINHPGDLLSRGQTILVKVIKVDGTRISLSMKDVDQHDGIDLNPQQQIDKEMENSKRHTKPVVDEGDYTASNRRSHKRLTSPERWEIKQLIASGVVSASQYPEIDTEYNLHMNGELESTVDEEFDVEIREDEPPFLQGQTRQSLELSPIRVVRAPDGSMNRAALSGGQMAKDRREAKDQAAREQQAATTNSARMDPAQTPQHGLQKKVLQSSLQPRQTSATDTSRKSHDEWREATNPKNGPVGQRNTMPLQQQRESLPVYALRSQFLRAIDQNQLLIVVGETGSGKTTQLTQYLAEEGFTNHGKIACTQPRRVAAMSVAKRVAEEVGCSLGAEVGYTIRFEDCTSSKTKIKYCTDGMLQRECLLDPDLKQYSVIILDEAHERTIATDVLFGLLKKSLKRRPDLKLIVTSATLDAEKFSTYFFDCPIFTIPGRTFPVEILHTKEPESDYLEASLMAVMQIHLSEAPGDILLFLTGQEEIDTSCEVLYERMKSLGPSVPELLILPIYSSLPSETQARVFEPAPRGSRKVVIATNIAETSITIDGIYYVIDPGFVKQNAYDPKLGMDSLIVTPISQAQARQRAGRAGRTGPGKCYRLYTEAAYRNEMLPSSIPEIQRQNLALTILMLKAMGINDLIRFDFMDPPPTQTLLSALEQLYTLGALDNEGLLTRIGRKMADFPMEPYLAKVLLASVDMTCSEEVLTIIAMLSTGGSVFYRPKDKQTLADDKKKKFNQPEGDHLTLLVVYNAWKQANYSKSWCQDNFINARALKRAQDIRNQLAGIMDRYKHQVISCGRNFDKVRRALVSGFFTHAAKRDPQEGYKTVVEGTPVYLHPSSAIFGRPAEWVIYHELIATTKEYMHCTTIIEPKWLPELAPTFFKTADPNRVSKAKARDKIVPLHDRFADKDDWRISKQRKLERLGHGNTFG